MIWIYVAFIWTFFAAIYYQRQMALSVGHRRILLPLPIHRHRVGVFHLHCIQEYLRDVPHIDYTAR